MWVINQNKTWIGKITEAWVSEKHNEDVININVTSGYGSEDEFYNQVGTYSKERGKAVFKELLKKIDSNEVFKMPNE